MKTASDYIYDRMCRANTKEVTTCAMSVIDRIQTQSIPNQILGIALLLLLMEEKYGVTPTEAANVADNILRHKDNAEIPEIRAIKAFMKNEWNI